MENEKKFAAPEIEIIHLDGSDIITDIIVSSNPTETEEYPDS